MGVFKSIKNIFFLKKISGVNIIYRILLVFRVKVSIYCGAFAFRILGIPVLYYNGEKSFHGYLFWFIPFFKFRQNVFYLFNLVPIFRIRLRFLEEIVANIVRKYDQYDSYILFEVQSGEFFLLMQHWKDFLKQNNLIDRKILLIFPFFKSHLSKMLKMFNYEQDYICLKEKVWFLYLDTKVGPLCGKYVYLPFCYNYIRDNNTKSINMHFYDFLKNRLNIKQQQPTGRYIISDGVKKKISDLRSKYEKIIFLCPFQQSIESLPNELWKSLCVKFESMGYTIICNTYSNVCFFYNCMHVNITYEEAIELASCSDAIVGMRSGLLDVLSQTKTKKIVFYTSERQRICEWLDAGLFLNKYTLSKLPNVNVENLYEFDAEALDLESIQQQVISILENK